MSMSAELHPIHSVESLKALIFFLGFVFILFAFHNSTIISCLETVPGNSSNENRKQSANAQNKNSISKFPRTSQVSMNSPPSSLWNPNKRLIVWCLICLLSFSLFRVSKTSNTNFHHPILRVISCPFSSFLKTPFLTNSTFPFLFAFFPSEKQTFIRKGKNNWNNNWFCSISSNYLSLFLTWACFDRGKTWGEGRRVGLKIEAIGGGVFGELVSWESN
jgi:hypothetical protein